MAEDKPESPVLDDGPGRSINLALIREACFPGEVDKHSADEVFAVKVLRLDWFRINEISGLEIMSHITELYLQHNMIRRIENLELLANLKFLALGNNRITRVEGLTRLTKLEFVDLSNNLIEEFDDAELPKTLLGVGLAGNPCALTDEYRVRLLMHLPKLEVLDFVPVPDYERAMVNKLSDQRDSDEEDDSEDDGAAMEAAYQREYASFFDDSLASDVGIRAAVEELRGVMEAAALQGLEPWEAKSRPAPAESRGETAAESAADPTVDVDDPESYAARRRALIEKHKAKLEAEKQAMRELAESSLEASAARLQAARDRLNSAKVAAVQRSKERRDEDESLHAALQAKMHSEFDKRTTSK